MAPMVFSSTSKARRICSAAKTSSSPISAARLNHFGLPARLAVAATPGAAWALSRFHRSPLFVLPSGEEAAALDGPSDRSFAAFAGNPHRAAPARLQNRRRADRTSRARRLPRVSLPNSCAGSTRRSAASTSRSCPIVAPPVYHSLHYLLEPIFTAAGDRRPRRPADAESRACADARRCRRARVAALPLSRRWRGRDDRYRADAADAQCLPCDAAHRRLSSKRWRQCEDAGFGFEAVGLAVTRAEAMPARQIELAPSYPSAGGKDQDGDRQQRGALRRLDRCAAPAARPTPRAPLRADRQPSSRARRNTAADRRRDPCIALVAGSSEQTRPLLLLPHAEPARCHRARPRRSAAAFLLARRDP